jgi:glutamate dehydrogenase
VRGAEAKAEAIHTAAARVRSQGVEGAEAERLERFIRLYFEHAPPEDVFSVDSADLYGAALAHYRFGERHRSGTPEVRVYTPRLADHGWRSPHTVVEVVVDDMPFIVDSVQMELSRHGLGIHRVLHPIIDGVSYVHVEVDRQSDPAFERELEDDLRRVLGDVRAAVEDWGPMADAMRSVSEGLRRDVPTGIDPDEVGEIHAFLNWLVDDNFTFLGYRQYSLETREGEDVLVRVPGTGLGILRQPDTAEPLKTFAKLPPEVRRMARSPEPLYLTKGSSVATVHRPAQLDHIGVKRFDATGAVIGEHRFLGLYTKSFYNSNPRAVPLLRRKVELVVDLAGLPAGGHSEKELVDILETYPRDELLQVDVPGLHETALGILHLKERRRVRLFMRRDRFGRFFSCLVFLPRDRYTTDTRLAIQAILLDTLGGDRIEHQARVSASVLTRLYFVIYVDPAHRTDVDVARLEARLADAVRVWADDLRDSLLEEHGEERGLRLFQHYRDAFGAGYRADNDPRIAVDDIERLEVLGDDDIGLLLYRPLEAASGTARFKLYRSGRPVLVSDVLPLLENFGARVVDQRPYKIRPAGRAPVWIYDFGLESEQFSGDMGRFTRLAELFHQAFARTWWRQAESDGLNRLVLLAQLPWRDVAVMRAYTKYLRQAGTTFSPDYVESAVAAHPDIAAQIVELFHARFTPDGGSGRDERADGLVEKLEAALDAIPSLDHDRILRSLLILVRATLRTNAFQRETAGTDNGPAAHLCFKLDPHRVPFLPLPLPAYEIFVYAPFVEGVHLRGGPVARGGIRWSDRREDYRTEILGLMKAQMVKNAVIVPVGAKGGFVVKQPPADRAALAAEVERCYRTFISGLLDLTDNRRGPEIHPPPQVVRYDGDDPYLVVAADKGTASFSDVANEVAARYGFWLGDAFASGGSAGYDHKRMGITARGAWESVKRHFHELGVDVDTATVSVVGIGDMSGDVFGNGMLRSPHVRLVAAFNHRYVFLDPDPDPAASFAERARLFELPRSSWADYDAAVLSPGGGVYARTDKAIPITPEVRRVLGFDAGVEALTPNEVIGAILRAPVDLLWNGGIGTFVKAAGETHAEVGDKTNDGIRVDAADLRCRVVAEGGNLGLTQRARIEFARAGGLINTDAIDNSGGVDCSDHEVNIKILLDPIVDDGDLTRKQRDALLAEMTEDVAALVLANNERQTQAIANSVYQSESLIDVHARYTRWLERHGGLDRHLEFLPTDDEYAERKARGEGLTGPELAVLLAYTKNTLEQSLLDTDLPEDEVLVDDLIRYFPPALHERFAGRIEQHRLRREIVAITVVSDMVDHQGITYAFRLADETGAHSASTARAFVVARAVFDMPALWSEVRGLDNVVPATVQTRLNLEGRKLVERATRWLLRHRRIPFDMGGIVERLAPGTKIVAGLLPEVLSTEGQEAHRARIRGWVGDGVPDALASRVAAFEDLFSALDICEVAAASDHRIEQVAGIYFTLEDRLQLRWLRDRVNELPRYNRWQTLARLALRDDLYNQLRHITSEALASGGVEPWMERRDSAIERTRQVLADIRSTGTFDLATLSVGLRETHALTTS